MRHVANAIVHSSVEFNGRVAQCMLNNKKSRLSIPLKVMNFIFGCYLHIFIFLYGVQFLSIPSTIIVRSDSFCNGHLEVTHEASKVHILLAFVFWCGRVVAIKGENLRKVICT